MPDLTPASQKSLRDDVSYLNDVFCISICGIFFEYRRIGYIDDFPYIKYFLESDYLFFCRFAATLYICCLPPSIRYNAHQENMHVIRSRRRGRPGRRT